MNSAFKIILLSAFSIIKVDAMSSGAPLEACDTMLPTHWPYPPLTSVAPIEILVSSDEVHPNTRINVTVRSTSFDGFRGFLIQARRVGGDTPLGQFHVIDSQAQTLNCFGSIQSAATHTNNQQKTEITLEWEAPADAVEFQFHVTAVASFANYWAPRTSQVLQVIPAPNDFDFIYEGCGEVKLCFGLPSDCIETRNCDLLSTVFDNDGEFEFELLGASGHLYIAFGLSQTPSMAAASVIECVNQEGIIIGFTSWNPNVGRTNTRADIPQDIIRTLETRLIDGRIYCKLQRDEVSTINEQVFDLRNEMHHLLIAGGTTITVSSVGPHGAQNRGFTSDKKWLTLQPSESTTNLPKKCEIDDLEDFVCGLEEEVEALSERVRILEEGRKALDSLKESNEKLIESNKNLQRRSETLEHEVESLRSENDGVKGLLYELKATVNDLSLKLCQSESK